MYRKKSTEILTYVALAASLLSISITLPHTNTLRSEEIQEAVSAQDTVPAKRFSDLLIDADNAKWFITENGLVSFDGKTWTLHNETINIRPENLKAFAFEASPDVSRIWIATPEGATAIGLPIKADEELTNYNPENTPILSKNIISVAVGNSPVRWFGTDKGISGLKNDKWLTPDYEELYPSVIFQDFPITTMTTSPDGDSLYVGTKGAGISRLFRNDIDGISGASSYAEWGPIIIPSDNVYSIFIAPDGSEWFGTDAGAAKHTGRITLENWEVFTTEEGLIDNYVQAITADKDGRLWFGTKGGISVFDGTSWTSYKTEDGLVSNNILCLGIDKEGAIWIGTDNGINCYKNGEFLSFK